MLYGNREKMKKEKFRKIFEDAKKKRNEEIKLNWD